MPDVPTLKDLGYNAEIVIPLGYAKPKGVPADILAKLDAAVQKSTKDAALADVLQKFSIASMPMTGKDFEAYIRSLKPFVGQVLVEGKPLQAKRYADAIARGLCYMSEDRKGDGLFLDDRLFLDSGFFLDHRFFFDDRFLGGGMSLDKSLSEKAIDAKVGKKLGVLDYTSAADQAKFTDEQAVKAIAEGARDKAGKERMKAYKDELSPQEIKDLVGMVRKFKS